MSRSPLSSLSDRELLGRLKSLVEKERATTVEILLHVNEVERRRLYLPSGYPSLFEYCRARLGYSSSAAGRRIAAARCVRDYPDVLGLLEKDEMTLVTVARLEGALTRENHRELLEKVRGKSDREVEEILSGYRPPVTLRDRVKPVRVAVRVREPQNTSKPGTTGCVTPSAGSSPATGSAAAGFARGLPRPGTETQPLPHSGTQSPPQPPTPPPAVRLEQRFQIQFVASEAFMTKLEKARALLSNRLQENAFEKVFEVLIDEFLDRHSPEKKKERREKRAAARQGPAKRREPGEPRDKATEDTGTRHIPASVKARVYARDQGRCTYVGTTDERCASTHHLQIDHIVPYGRGGTTTVGNLRLLCGRHNRLEAERIYGANAIRRYRPTE